MSSFLQGPRNIPEIDEDEGPIGRVGCDAGQLSGEGQVLKAAAERGG